MLKVFKNKLCKNFKPSRGIGTGNVINTNNCEISVCKTKQKNRYVIFSTIDNLVKGPQVKQFRYEFNYGLKLQV